MEAGITFLGGWASWPPSFPPQRTEVSRDQVFIRHGIFNQTIFLRKAHQAIDGVARYFGFVKRGVTLDEAGYQLSLVGRE
jgi:hypothetical protein